MAELVGLADTSVPAEEGFWAVRRLLETLAHQEPLVVVFDDLNWAEPTLLDLVEHIAEWSRDAAILLVAMARPDLPTSGRRGEEARTPRRSPRAAVAR